MELIPYSPYMPLWCGQGKHYLYLLQYIYMFIDFNNILNVAAVLHECGYDSNRPVVTIMSNVIIP
jgi:hypothetical protein